MSIMSELMYLSAEDNSKELSEQALAMWMGVSRPIEDHNWSLQNPDLSILDRISSSLDSNWDKRITSIKDIEVFIMAIENVHLYNKPDQDHHRVLS